MSSLDVDGWQRVLQGKERLTWDLWAANAYSSDILTASGMDLLKSAIQEFREFFGEDFLDRCRGKNHPLFSIYLMPGNDVHMVYMGLIDIFVHLQLLQTKPNFGELRKALRRDKSSFGWGHALLQLEVAGLALRQERDIEFEPDLASGRKADLKVSTGDQVTTFEVVQMGTDHCFRETASFRNQFDTELMRLSMTHSVSIRGELFRIPNELEREHMIENLYTKAKALNTRGESFVFSTDLATLTVTKSERRGAPELSGPPTKSDVWARLEARIKDKARQTLGTKNVWIRIDDLSGMWYFTGWANQPLREKLMLIAPLCQAEIRKYDHVAGILLSNRWTWQSGQPEETVCVDGNFALRRLFSDDRERETLIIRRDKRSRQEVDVFTSWYAQEPSWLDWGLIRLGHPTTSEIFTQKC